MLFTVKTLALLTLGCVAATVKSSPLPGPGGLPLGNLNGELAEKLPNIYVFGGDSSGRLGAFITKTVDGRTHLMGLPADYRPPAHLDTVEKLGEERGFLLLNGHSLPREELSTRVAQSNEAGWFHSERAQAQAKAKAEAEVKLQAKL